MILSIKGELPHKVVSMDQYTDIPEVRARIRQMHTNGELTGSCRYDVSDVEPVTLSPDEVAAVRHMIAQLSRYCREDVIGTVLYTGAFRLAKDIVALTRKLELQ